MQYLLTQQEYRELKDAVIEAEFRKQDVINSICAESADYRALYEELRFPNNPTNFLGCVYTDGNRKETVDHRRFCDKCQYLTICDFTKRLEEEPFVVEDL